MKMWKCENEWNVYFKNEDHLPIG